MVESVGKKLNQARVKRGLTIDEAAHATKLRPDKIAALESDDYSRFANNIYAKGFLQIYARFLQVDVADFSRTLDNSNPISVSDYQYLSNAPAPRRGDAQVYREARKPPSVAPLLFFIFILGFCGVLYWAFTKYQQITGERLTRHGTTSEAVGVASPGWPAAPVPPAPVATPALALAPVASTPAPAPTPHNGPLQLASPAPGPAFVAPGAASPAPLVRTEPSKSGDRDVVTPTSVPTADPSAHAVPASGVNELLVAAVKKTWVTVRRDDPKAPPIFADYIYPNANPLKLKGARFFIEARDPSAVQITKNGLPVAYQAPNVPVQ